MIKKYAITLVTLVIAITIISVLSTITIISVNDVISEADLKTFALEIYNLQTLVDKYKTKNNGELDFTTYSANVSSLTGPLQTIFTEDSPGKDVITLYLLDQDALNKLGAEYIAYGSSNAQRDIGEIYKDIYAVSENTGRLYYLYGYDFKGDTYYYLTDGIITDILLPNLESEVASDILFIPSTFGKTREAVKVSVKVPRTVDISTVSVTTPGNNNPVISSYTVEGNYYVYTVNTNNWKGNYTVNVDYVENSENRTEIYNVEEYLGVYAVLYSDGEMRINNTGKIDKSKIEAGNTVILQSEDITDSTTIPWSSNATSINTVTFENEVIPTYVASWFNGCTNLTEVNNIEYLDTRNVTSMANMFAKCKNLKELDISTLDASSLNNMYWMFYGCTNLVDLNMTGFTVPNRVNLEEAFRSCSKLKSIDFSGISKVKSMYGTFRDCAALTELDLNHITEVTSISTTFMGCNSLVTLKVENMDVSNIKSLQYTFANCQNLEALNLSKWNVGRVTTLEYTFHNCYKLKELDLNNWNTSQVTNMHATFMDCSSLENVNVSNWNTGIATTFRAMFQGASALKEIDMTNWNVSNVTTARGMFYGCTNLKTVKANNWGANKIADMSYMFIHCTNLESVYFTNLIITSVTDMTYAFYDLGNMKNIYMNKATFNQVTSYSNMFFLTNAGTMVVADETAKTWIKARLEECSNTKVVVKTVDEL